MPGSASRTWRRISALPRILRLVRRPRPWRRGQNRPGAACSAAAHAGVVGRAAGRARERNYAICGSPRGALRGWHAAGAGRSGSTGNVATVSDVAALNHLSSGKVRDIYAVGEDRLLLVASDRISTYDVVHPTPIPDKGKLLTGLTAFWLDRTGEVCPNHLISFSEVPEEFRGRAMLVERLEMVPVECVVRGYITGSGWKDYQSTGAVCGIELPGGLRESEQLPDADLHARHEGRGGRPRRERGLRPRRRDRGRPRAARGASPPVDRDLRAGRRPRARARDHPRRHEVRVRPPAGRDDRARATR